MVSKSYFKLHRLLPLITLSFLFLFYACHHDDQPEPDLLPANYEGTLEVTYSNVYPPWTVTKEMDVNIEKVHGNITIAGCTLAYSGDTIIDNDSKIERSGQWQINPTGKITISGDDKYISVNAHVTVQNDVTRIYGKDNDGNWVLLTETNNSETPNSDLVFKLSDAIVDGSTVGFNTPGGGLIWTMLVLPNLTGK